MVSVIMCITINQLVYEILWCIIFGFYLQCEFKAGMNVIYYMCKSSFSFLVDIIDIINVADVQRRTFGDWRINIFFFKHTLLLAKLEIHFVPMVYPLICLKNLLLNTKLSRFKRSVGTLHFLRLVFFYLDVQYY